MKFEHVARSPSDMITRYKFDYEKVVTTTTAGYSKKKKSDSNRKEPSVLHRVQEIYMENVDDITERYDVLKVLGEGHYAKIFLAANKRTGTTVVLKAVHAELTTLKDFYREFHYSYYLSPHPNVLSTYPVAFRSGGAFYVFAQEFAPWGDLAGAVKAGGLYDVYCKRIAEQLASALEFLHSKQLVHRDVKLENILIFSGDFAKIKLCDFGETRKEGVLVGKTKCTWQSFLPPEMCDALPQEKFICKPASDCWQAAVVLFVCATGNTPWPLARFASDREYANFCNWQRRKTTKIPQQFKKFTPRLQRMFRRLLARKPEDRSPITEIRKYLKDSWFVVDGASSNNNNCSNYNNNNNNNNNYNSSNNNNNNKAGFNGPHTPTDRKNSDELYFNRLDDDDSDDDNDDTRVEADDGKIKMAKVLSSYGLETTVDQSIMSKRLHEWVLSCETDYNNLDTQE